MCGWLSAASGLASRSKRAPAPPAPGPATDRTALAVLPFKNLSVDPADAYFAVGLHDELLTQLSKVAALSLRGRTSVMGYAETTKPIRQIAEELQVRALVEGSVQVVGGRLRVNVQLIDALTDEHLWAESYDRTLDDAFAIQSDVAQRVVAAVGAALARDERRAIAETPTANAEAYRFYLQGLEYHRRPDRLRSNFEIAQQLYERAIALDPDFALAQAALAEIHALMYWLRLDPLPERVEAFRTAAEAAVQLDPDLPQARMAMGLWLVQSMEVEEAVAELEMALRRLPNDANLVNWLGQAHRVLGNWDEVYAAFDRAVELDPGNANLFYDLGGATYQLTRRYADAIRAYDQALALAPDHGLAAHRRAITHIQWRGDLTQSRSLLGTPEAAGTITWIRLYLYDRDATGLLEYLERIGGALSCSWV
jgi:TolB-like protein